MKFVALSDTHGAHNAFTIPDGDVFIHCGDFGGESLERIGAFTNWLHMLPHKYKIIIAGNHDALMERDATAKTLFKDFIYLENSGVEIEGINIWGSPTTSVFLSDHYVFQMPDDVDRRAIYQKIPNNLDVLITHSPPYGIFDLCVHGNVGCRWLRQISEERRPKYHLFGHIHEGGGSVQKVWSTTYANCAGLNRDYQPQNLPFIFEI